MLAEGKNAVFEALNSEIKIEKILVLDSLEKSLTEKNLIKLITEKSVNFEFCKKDVLDRISETKRHQGFIAFLPDFKYSEIEDILNRAKSLNQPNFIMLLDGITDPHNLGSIIRVCECVGVHGIIIPKNRSCEINATVMRCSAGALNHMPVAKVTNLNSAIDFLKKKNVFVYGADSDGVSMYKTNLKGNLAIVIGSEGEGLHRLTRELCDSIISIPMAGKINSLNASVAAGVVLYEAARQRLLN